jgi:methylmalonyl-CoA/ethylmalonyl-CoA epimerase
MLKKILHVGVVSEDFEHAVERFKGFGLRCTEVIERKEVELRIAFFSIGDSLIEVLCFMGSNEGHDDVVRSQKGAINHLCFEVDDLEASIQEFVKNGARLVDGFPRPGAQGRIAFFYPETTESILIELCQV